MPRACRTLFLASLFLLGCASTAPPPPAAPRRSARPTPMPGGVSPVPMAPGCMLAREGDGDDGRGLEVRGTAGDPNEISVQGTSDLPTGPTSTNTAWTDTARRSLAAVLPALGECLRPLCAPARHRVRLSVNTEGAVLLRPPQSFPMPTRVGRCVEGALAAITLEVPPPRTVPIDVTVDVAP